MAKHTLNTARQRHQSCRSGFFTVKFEQISHIVLMFPLLNTIEVNTSWVSHPMDKRIGPSEMPSTQVVSSGCFKTSFTHKSLSAIPTSS